MSGLDVDLPVYIFRQTCDEYCDHVQLEYALNWDDGKWSLYRFDRANGNLLEEFTGYGHSAYIDALKANGIVQEAVAFGAGIPGEK